LLVWVVRASVYEQIPLLGEQVPKGRNGGDVVVPLTVRLLFTMRVA
jgi:hypothetical protein